MNSKLIKLIIRFILLILFQVIVFNHINFFGYINPMIYVSWVILFPIEKGKSKILITSFLMGLIIDMFSDSGGIHTMSLVLIAYFRLNFLQMIMRKTDFDYLLFNIKNIPLTQSLLYITSLTLLHHFILFNLIYFNLTQISQIISNTILTSLLTIILCFFGILLFIKKSR